MRIKETERTQNKIYLKQVSSHKKNNFHIYNLSNLIYFHEKHPSDVHIAIVGSDDSYHLCRNEVPLISTQLKMQLSSRYQHVAGLVKTNMAERPDHAHTNKAIAIIGPRNAGQVS